ncbi:endonuclease/exonuclease/phosphatase family protein [Bernardetia sp. ABR2-2B]|uniref:endonuclease/exonuclease/phosphatase family protein n=1 Tax=Bernardetia sp. ABR2-2B TaxID=3127472 RepID=UPI0030D48FBC
MSKNAILFLTPLLFFLASLLSLFPFWLGDLFSHFRIFWTVLSVVLMIVYSVFVYQKKINQLFLVFPLATLLINWNNSPQFLYNSSSYWKQSQTYQYLFLGSPSEVEYAEEIESDKTIKKLLLMNILSSNTNYEDVKRTIKNANADFVVIIELDKKWKTKLEEIEKQYSYQYMKVREDNFGMGIYSKTNFIEAISLDSVHNKSKSLEANKYSMNDPNLNYYINQKKMRQPCIEVKNTNQISIVIAHPTPPITSKAYDRRNNYLQEVSLMVNKKPKTLLVGDLNCSPFSADYQKFLKRSGLKDSQESFGFQPTWNTSFPFLMQTPIDHVWHSDDIEILHRQTLPIKGSDHKAVLVSFR